MDTLLLFNIGFYAIFFKISIDICNTVSMYFNGIINAIIKDIPGEIPWCTIRGHNPGIPDPNNFLINH